MEGDDLSLDAERMKAYGFIYADGSYSDERLPKGATLVPRRPSINHKWDWGKRAWVKVPSETPSQAKQVEVPTPVVTPAAEVPAVQPDAEQDLGISKMLASTVTPEGER